MTLLKKSKHINFLGWFGGCICLTGYASVTQQILPSDSLIFLTMNAVGCACLIYYTFCKKAFANTILNSVYMLLTMIAVFKVWLGWK